jgi:hypothetical protein
MPDENDAIEILRTFIADEDKDLGTDAHGGFWPRNWHRIAPLAEKAERLLGADEHQQFCLHYMRRESTPPIVSQNALPRLLAAYRDLWPRVDWSRSLVERHVLTFIFGFDQKGRLPSELLQAADLKVRKKLIAHISSFAHLPGMRAKPRGFLPFVSQAQHIHQVLRHIGYRHDNRNGENSDYRYANLRFWGLVYTVLLAKETRAKLLADMLDERLDLPKRNDTQAILNHFVQAVLPTCDQDEVEFRALADRLAALERTRAGLTESVALAQTLGLPFEDDEAWAVEIKAPAVGHAVWYNPPNIKLEFRPDPDHDWHLQLTAGEHRLSEYSGKVTQNDGRLEPLGKLAAFPAWLRQIRQAHGLAFDFAKGRISCGKKRSAAKTLMQWIEGEP